MATWDDVERLALALPEASEAVKHRTRHWCVGDKTFVWERPQKGRNDPRMVADGGQSCQAGGRRRGPAPGLTKAAQVP